MKTLVIHPEDPTTTFLERVYEGLDDTTVIRGGMNPIDVAYAMQKHDRVIALGHGTPLGLLSVGKFGGSHYVIDERHISALKKTGSGIYIWCHADQFVQRFHLSSILYSGMFISEIGEAYMLGLENTQPQDVSVYNDTFASFLNKELKANTLGVCDRMVDYIDTHGPYSQVSSYNTDRLYSNP